MYKSIRWNLIPLVIFVLTTQTAIADFLLQPRVGVAISSHADYEKAAVKNLMLGYDFNHFMIKAGFWKLSAFKMETVDYAHIDMRAASVSVSQVFAVPAVNIELGGGIFFSESDVVLSGHEIGKGSDSSIMLDLRLSKQFANVTPHISFSYVDEVAGKSSLFMTQLGILFHF